SEQQGRWSARADELQAAALAAFTGPDGLLVGERGARAWALWPVELFPKGDPRIDAEADRMLDDLEAVASGRSQGSSYDAKLTTALAVELPQGERRARLDAVVKRLVTRVPTPTR